MSVFSRGLDGTMEGRNRLCSQPWTGWPKAVVSVTGTRWHRHFDTAATALTVGGLSAVHARYLAAGGLDFIIGDGRLNYGPEYVWESYYSARLLPGFFTTFDLQRVVNPAYNQDRGPVWVSSIRLHVELGK